MSLKGSILVTGGNGGLGSAIISRIASTELGQEYHGIYTVRSPKSADSVRSSLESCRRKHKHDFVTLDLSSLSSVRACAADINNRVAEGSLPRIRALIICAGYQEATTQAFTDDGFDMTFQANFLSHFLFTLLVLQSMDKEHGRVLVVGSWSHDPTDPRNLFGPVSEAFKGYQTLFTRTEALARGTWSTPQEDPTLLAGYRRYGAGKLCEIMFMYELQARILKDPALANICVVGLDPGGMGTGLLRRGSWFTRVLAAPALRATSAITTLLSPNGMFRSTSKSAADALRACFDSKTVGEKPRALYFNGSEVHDTSAEAKDEVKRTMLWTDSVGYAGLKEGDTVLTHWQ